MRQLTLAVLDEFGLDADVQLTVRHDVVEVHHEGSCRAVFRRFLLREWLLYPEGRLTKGDVSFVLSTGGILLRVLPSIPGHALTSAALAELGSLV